MIDLDQVDNAKVLLKKWCNDGMESISTPIRYGQLLGLMNKLSEAEKDAARYRWLMENCGKILEPARNRTHLYLPNYCPLSMDYVDVSKHIDEAMQCK